MTGSDVPIVVIQNYPKVEFTDKFPEYKMALATYKKSLRLLVM